MTGTLTLYYEPKTFFLSGVKTNIDLRTFLRKGCHVRYYTRQFFRTAGFSKQIGILGMYLQAVFRYG